jgi:hypothetical protein
MARPRFSWKPRRRVSSNTRNLTLSSLRDYGSTMYDFNRMPSRVQEYQRPAGMFSRNGTVRNLGYRESEEGIHVGSRNRFSGWDRRQQYRYIRVEFDGIYCDYYGEDAFTVDPLARAIIRKGQWKGRIGKGSDRPGGDKCFQVDGGVLEVRGRKTGSVLIDSAQTAIRAKTNSILYLKNIDFSRCSTAIRGDGGDNPSRTRFFNGTNNKCVIYVRNCRFWDCGTIADAKSKCVIIWGGGNKIMSGKDRFKDSGSGKIIKSGKYSRFKEEALRLKRSSRSEWRSNSSSPFSW